MIANAGETVEIHYMNEGQQIHPMHLHGIPQLVIAKDGYPLPAARTSPTPCSSRRASATRCSSSRPPTEKGVWACHCHILSHAEHDDGMMFGMVTTFIVQ